VSCVFSDQRAPLTYSFYGVPRRQILDTPPRPKGELPYRCTCAGGQTNLVRPPSRPSPPFLPAYLALAFDPLSAALLTARGFKIKSGPRESKRTANFVRPSSRYPFSPFLFPSPPPPPLSLSRSSKCIMLHVTCFTTLTFPSRSKFRKSLRGRAPDSNFRGDDR